MGRRVCGRTRPCAERFERAVQGVPCYDDEEEMFDRHPEIEAAVLASANSEHLRQVEACARRGIHILSMKIPTFDLAEYDRMIELVEEAGVVCQIELELHYNPVVQRIKKLVARRRRGSDPVDAGDQHHALARLGLPVARLARSRATAAGFPWPTATRVSAAGRCATIPTSST